MFPERTWLEISTDQSVLAIEKFEIRKEKGARDFFCSSQAPQKNVCYTQTSEDGTYYLSAAEGGRRTHTQEWVQKAHTSEVCS